jgi:hypothetical protein
MYHAILDLLMECFSFSHFMWLAALVLRPKYPVRKD